MKIDQAIRSGIVGWVGFTREEVHHIVAGVAFVLILIGIGLVITWVERRWAKACTPSESTREHEG